MPADITILNLNMLYIKYVDGVDRENHVPLGPLYVTAALERAGFAVDFRDYQLVVSDDPFAAATICDFLDGAADLVGVSVMANLLPFTLLALREFKRRHPEKTVILAGVGPKEVETAILERFPWIDLVVCGESELVAPALVAALTSGGDLAAVPGIFYRDAAGRVVRTARPPRITALDALPLPAFDKIDLANYRGYGVASSRGCPWPCTFCSVAPVWDHLSYARSARSVIAEMRHVHERTGATMFLFQDEYFLSSRERMFEFAGELKASGLPLKWKAFGRVNLTDRATMEAMADAGCVEIRYGIESGSDAVLERIKKGFTNAEALAVVAEAVEIFPHVDAFFVWGFPFETMADFHQTLFSMLTMKSMGANILPSLLSILPQTEIYKEIADLDRLEFTPALFPEYMVTGHETYRTFFVEIDPRHRPIYELIQAHKDLFPGFFHYDLAGNVYPKLELLQEYGFYPKEKAPKGEPAPRRETESCGAHSPRLRPSATATRL